MTNSSRKTWTGQEFFESSCIFRHRLLAPSFNCVHCTLYNPLQCLVHPFLDYMSGSTDALKYSSRGTVTAPPKKSRTMTFVMLSLVKNQPWSLGQSGMTGCLENRARLANSPSSESLGTFTMLPVRMMWAQRGSIGS